MDVQTENMDPPPGESQPSGKIRKGFKLFGKRKPGNIFSIRSKGDGNNKSPVNRSKTIDGLSDTAAPDMEPESDKEKRQEVSQGEREQAAEEEPLGEDGVQAAAAARASISSASSAKSLSFLSLLRGGRRGMGDRRVQTVSQPVGRQRRGLKGLFGTVKFRSKDKEEKEDAPPSPLLMSSRANSVEIIKEDLTLTPEFQPRSLDSPESESSEPITRGTTPDREVLSPSETITPQVTAGNLNRTEELLPQPPLVPGDNSLSSLLADISSLLTFDSISGGGDFMADVEAEWGKASNAIGAAVSEVTPSSASFFSKPTISSPLTSTSVSTAATVKPCFPTTASSQYFSPLTKTAPSSSPIAKPSTIITTLTKSSTLTTPSVKLSSDSTAASSVTIKSTPTPTATELSKTPVTFTSLSGPLMSSSSITIKSTQSSTTATTTAPVSTPATVVKAPSASPNLTSTASKLASELAATSATDSVSKPTHVATPPLVSAKPPPVKHSPPTPVAFTQPPPAKLDSARSLNWQTSTSYKPSLLSSSAGEAKAPVTVSATCTVTTKPSFPPPVIPSKITTVPTSTTTSGLVSMAISKPTITSSPMDLTKTPPSLVTVPDYCPPSVPSFITKSQPSPASVPTPSSNSLDNIPPTSKPTPAPLSLDNMPPAPKLTPAPSTHAVVCTASPTPPVLAQSSKAPPAPAQIPISMSKELPAPAQIPITVSKDPPAQIPVSVSKDPPAQIPITVSKDPPAEIPITVSKDSPAQIPITVSKYPPAQIPVSVSKDPPAQIPVSVFKDHPAQIPVSVSKDPPAQIPVSVSKDPPAQIPVSVSKDPPAQIPVSVSKDPPAQIPVSVSKDPPTQIHVSVSRDLPLPAQIPVSVSRDPPLPAQIPVSVSRDPPLPAQIPISISKDPPLPAQTFQPKAFPAPSPAPYPVSPLPSGPAPWLSEAPSSAKMTGSGQVSADCQLVNPSSTGILGAQTRPSKTKELPSESRTNLQDLSREKKSPQVKASGLSKIPVVGGGRAGKLPVRESQHFDDEASRDPPTPEYERPHFDSHDAARSKDKISDIEANVPALKHTLEENQPPPQPKVPTSVQRDSKIPVKHGATASQIPQAKEPPRSKIPTSKVPVRRVGNKPAAAGGSTQTRR
ncbi:flocculation protein FLO11 [Hippoglossus stenolepis]|uniref:flocculation protein FLO11 n=1 Tax=Hippoglossus stenolepis TaxID=195615 RepID=UPI001FAF5C9F|nr:flocculation protein FLO11 [Hippoglossus stenolepis]